MVSRVALGMVFIGAGLLHFALPGVYVKIMPPMLPAPLALVYVSGVAEMLGGIGVLMPFAGVRWLAAVGLAALLVAVWPANLYMALRPDLFPSIPGWAFWVRLPLQAPLIWWAWTNRR